MNAKSKQKEIKIGTRIFCPSNGVGIVLDIEKREYIGEAIVLFKILFEDQNITLYIPIENVENMGIRHLCSKAELYKAMEYLNRPAKMNEPWAVRLQINQASVNSGDPVLIAKAIGNLYSERPCYSEKSLCETAMNRFALEAAYVLGKTPEETHKMFIEKLESRKAPPKQKQEKEEDDEFEDLDLDIYNDSDDEEKDKKRVA